MADTKTVEAHYQDLTVHVRLYYPAHEPRETDPHYAVFHQSRKLLEARGKLVCWRCGKDAAASGHPIELHHSHIEQAEINGMDVAKIMQKHPEWNVHDEDELLAYLEGPGNLTALCVACHRGIQGVHCIPGPNWEPGAYQRDDMPPLAQVIHKGE